MEYATRVASFIKPGVDVAVYSTKLDNKSEKAVTTLLFKSARVLAVGTETKVTAQAVDEDISDFITLAIRFDEASKLINATKVSSLYLALLNESSLIGSQNVQK
jgi:Flp pilus assembly protein CpaB